MSKSERPTYSKYIGDFCTFVANAQQDYNYYREEVGKMDKLTQDYLHDLESGRLNYRERAKLSTELARCRRARRNSKDIVEMLTPLIEFCESEKGRQAIYTLQGVLGKTRKIERNMNVRSYHYRVLNK